MLPPRGTPELLEQAWGLGCGTKSLTQASVRPT